MKQIYKENLAVSLYRMYKYEEAVLLYDQIKREKPEKSCAIRLP